MNEIKTCIVFYEIKRYDESCEWETFSDYGRYGAGRAASSAADVIDQVSAVCKQSFYAFRLLSVTLG